MKKHQPPIELSKLPKEPGVYLMKSAEGEILYIGKARNLRQRVRQYFTPGHDSREMIPYLTAQVAHIETIVVSNEKEALLLENNLIKLHHPKYNVFFRDDKSYICLSINHLDKWPRVKLVRYKGKPKVNALHFGPYTSAYAARQTLDLIQRIFPLRQCSDQEFARRTRPCILHGMKRCIAPCVGLCSQEEYAKHTRNLVQFLKGQNKEVLRDLKSEMEAASIALEFERAGSLYQTIQAIERTMEQQHVDKLDGGNYDVYGFYREASKAVIAQLIYRSGKLIDSKNFEFSQVLEEDHELFPSWLLQRYQAKEEIPKEILLPFAFDDHHSLQEILVAKKAEPVKLLFPKRGEKKRLLDIAMSNAQTAFNRIKAEKDSKEILLTDLQEALKLESYPSRIDCFDTSNISGSHPVASLVTFLDGEKDRRGYRLYNLKTVKASDDYGAMREVLQRRYLRARDEDDLPNLIIIDGGKGHLNLALELLSALDITNVDVIGVAKESSRHDKGMTSEQVHTAAADHPVTFAPHSPVLFLLQRIRDEAHRRAIGHQRKRHHKGVIKSDLDAIPGIGPIKKKRLLKHFGSLRKLGRAKQEEILAIPGLTQKDTQAIRAFFDSKSNS